MLQAMLRLLATPTMRPFFPSRSMPRPLPRKPSDDSGDPLAALAGADRGRRPGLDRGGLQRLRRLHDRPLQDVEPLLELLLGDHQGHQRPDDVAVGPRADDDETTLVAQPHDAVHQLFRRLLRGPVLDELDRPHRPDAAHVADGRALLPQRLEPVADLLRDPGPSLGASMISARPVIEDNGRPAAIDFEAIRMSGSIPQCSQAHIFPVRPNPVCTSSAITRMSYLRQMLT